ncbi:MAG: formate/nitrite transporter family protein [Rhodospirillales bacterium]|nr:formate/nitrite transporter family protein [Rhodospirillales bacterium]
MNENRSAHPFDIDAYSPAQIAQRVEAAGVAKAHLPFLQTLVLGVLAGAFIAFGGMSYTVVVTGSELGLGPTRLLGGVAFSLGLILVVIGGAELFTGNNLIAMAWAERRVTTRRLLQNWLLVYVGNAVGAVASAVAVLLSGILEGGGGDIQATAAAIARAKIELDGVEAFFRGILCNALVCLAVWLCFAAHSVSGKILAVLFPISAFVALGFEHSVANMYLIPVGLFSGAATPGSDKLVGLVQNVFVVTLGNIVGGTILVALVYWLVYLRPGGVRRERKPASATENAEPGTKREEPRRER